ncbi:MAG: hypothetical protein II007_12820 [Gammaproteobacteria bacterium]|nr:hypothetical protein [Gammaproteobacteria bacterium]
MSSTHDYYNTQAEQFVADTLAVDMAELYAPFLSTLPISGHLLDAGCGSGRDALAFKQRAWVGRCPASTHH